MSALAVAEVEVEEVVRCYDQVVAEALDAFTVDGHYMTDMIRAAQRVLAKKSARLTVVD